MQKVFNLKTSTPVRYVMKIPFLAHPMNPDRIEMRNGPFYDVTWKKMGRIPELLLSLKNIVVR